MPLDKMPHPEEFIPTHKSIILHRNGEPAACIIDLQNNNFDYIKDHSSLLANLTGFLNKDDELGLLLGLQLKLKINEEFFIYTVYPDMEFVDTVIFNETLYIINQKLENLFSLKVNTDQFVKTKYEFKKFQKMIK